MGARRDEKKNSHSTYAYAMQAEAARDEARKLVEEARAIRDEVKALVAPKPEAVLEPAASPEHVTPPEPAKEPEKTPEQAPAPGA